MARHSCDKCSGPLEGTWIICDKCRAEEKSADERLHHETEEKFEDYKRQIKERDVVIEFMLIRLKAIRDDSGSCVSMTSSAPWIWREVREVAAEAVDKAQPFAKRLVKLTDALKLHPCLSGDCPHEKANDCLKALTDEIERLPSGMEGGAS